MLTPGGRHSSKFEHTTWAGSSGIRQLSVLEKRQYILCNPTNNPGQVIQLNLGQPRQSPHQSQLI